MGDNFCPTCQPVPQFEDGELVVDTVDMVLRKARYTKNLVLILEDIENGKRYWREPRYIIRTSRLWEYMAVLSIKAAQIDEQVSGVGKSAQNG